MKFRNGSKIVQQPYAAVLTVACITMFVAPRSSACSGSAATRHCSCNAVSATCCVSKWRPVTSSNVRTTSSGDSASGPPSPMSAFRAAGCPTHVTANSATSLSEIQLIGCLAVPKDLRRPLREVEAEGGAEPHLHEHAGPQNRVRQAAPLQVPLHAPLRRAERAVDLEATGERHVDELAHAGVSGGVDELHLAVLVNAADRVIRLARQRGRGRRNDRRCAATRLVQ